MSAPLIETAFQLAQHRLGPLTGIRRNQHPDPIRMHLAAVQQACEREERGIALLQLDSLEAIRQRKSRTNINS